MLRLTHDLQPETLGRRRRRTGRRVDHAVGPVVREQLIDRDNAIRRLGDPRHLGARRNEPLVLDRGGRIPDIPGAQLAGHAAEQLCGGGQQNKRRSAWRPSIQLQRASDAFDRIQDLGKRGAIGDGRHSAQCAHPSERAGQRAAARRPSRKCVKRHRDLGRLAREVLVGPSARGGRGRAHGVRAGRQVSSQIRHAPGRSRVLGGTPAAHLVHQNLEVVHRRDEGR